MSSTKATKSLVAFNYRHLSEVISHLSLAEGGEESDWEFLGSMPLETRGFYRLALRLKEECAERVFSESRIAALSHVRRASEDYVGLLEIALRGILLHMEPVDVLHKFNLEEAWPDETVVRGLLRSVAPLSCDETDYSALTPTEIVISIFNWDFAEQDEPPIHESAYLDTTSPDSVFRSKAVRNVTNGNVLAAYGMAKVELAIEAYIDSNLSLVVSLLADAAECLTAAVIVEQIDLNHYFGTVERTAKAVGRANMRHSGNHKLRARAIELFESRKWKSVRNAAEQIHELLIPEYCDLGASLSPTGGRDTIYLWLLSHKKAKNV